MLESAPTFHDGMFAYRAASIEPFAVEQHRHPTIALTVPLLGGLTSLFDGGEAWISGPSAVLHPTDGLHGGIIGDVGVDAVEIEFDPAWLRRRGIAAEFDRTRHWAGGRTAAAALKLARVLNNSAGTAEQREGAVAAFFHSALNEPPPPQPSWLNYVTQALEEHPRPSVKTLAARLDLNPSWLGQAYRASVGEGILDTITRGRVERAASLLRSSTDPLAQIAIEVGFADQSHMTRCFRTVLGRTPSQVRATLRQASAD